MSKRQIGVIGVDAGIVWIGDPCYILHKSKKDQPKAIGKNWEDFCSRLGSQDPQFNYDLGHPGLGVCVGTPFGDGEYPVYAEYEDGHLARIIVDFMESDDGESE